MKSPHTWEGSQAKTKANLYCLGRPEPASHGLAQLFMAMWASGAETILALPGHGGLRKQIIFVVGCYPSELKGELQGSPALFS